MKKQLFLLLFSVSLCVPGGAAYAQKMIEHFVEKGETLTIIAAEYGVQIEDILLANPGVLKNENTLRLGTKLNIPPCNYLKSGVASNSYPNGTWHFIATGEYLSAIADLYEGVGIGDLMRVNNLQSVDEQIKRGRLLIIPPPKGTPLVIEKLDNRHLLEIVGDLDNPYIKPEYLQALKAPGQDPMHDLARDYALDVTKKEEEAPKESTPKVSSEEKKEEYRVYKQSPIAEEEGETRGYREQRQTPADKTQQVQPQSKDYENNIFGREQVKQAGWAQRSKNLSNENKYLAYYREDTVGMSITVVNPETGQRVIVRVMAALPANAPEDVIIQLSENAFAKICPDDRILAYIELEYVKP